MKEITIAAAVLILCILLIRRIFRGKVSSRLLYALWLLAAFRLVIPISAKMDLGLFSQFQPTELVRQAELSGGFTNGRLEEPIQISLSGANPLFRFFVSSAAKEAVGGADGPTSVFIAGKLGFAGIDILRFIWKAGMIAVALWMAAVNFHFFCRLRRERKDFELPENLVEIGGKRKKKIRVYTAEHLASPCLYGFPGREAVYLTQDVAADADKLRHVLVHELVHKKHGDSFWALLRSILVTVYWFHPLVWVAAACSKRDCELACDEGALALLGEEERIPYGETLLSIITRRGRVSDLVCTATTMTGSAKSVKERIQFIVKKPGVLYTAVAALVAIMAVICLFAFTRDSWSDGVRVDEEEGLTVTGADMLVHLPASIGGISGCVVEGENEDIVVYHQNARQEVGRFARLPLKDALELVDAGREVKPLGDQGYNYLLRAYLGEPLEWTEHTFTSAVPVTDSNSVTTHTYTPADGQTQGVLSHEDVYISEDISDVDGVPGTDSNDDTTYIMDDEAVPPEKKMDYLPNETIAETVYLPPETITTTTYRLSEINVDELDGGCYIYVTADFSRVQKKYLEEMRFIDDELKTAGDGAIILSLNSKRREELFDALTENRTPYIGDNSKVGALLTALPLPPSFSQGEGFTLQTMEQPYSLRYSFEISTDVLSKEDENTLYFNAAMLFYTVGNLEEVVMDVRNPGNVDGSYFRYYRREKMEEEFAGLLEADYEDGETFREGLEKLYSAVEERSAYLTWDF